MAKYIQLSISLDHAPYAINRQLQIPADTDLHQLHYYLQLAMGWQLSHLHSFLTKQGNYTDYEDEFEGSDDLLEFNVPVSQVLNAKQREIKYWYDYSDDWVHTVRYEGSSIRPDDEGVTLLSANGVCPREDSGGVYHLRKNSRTVDSAAIQGHLTRFYQFTVQQGYAQQPSFVAVMENEAEPSAYDDDDDSIEANMDMIVQVLQRFSSDMYDQLDQAFGHATLNAFIADPFSHKPYHLAAPPAELAAQAPIMIALQPLFEALTQAPVKLTAAGYLPVKLVKGMYNALHDMPSVPIFAEYQYQAPSSESNVNVVSVLRHILTLSALAKETKNKIELTAKGRKLLSQGDTSGIYFELFKTALNILHWGCITQDDSCPRQQFMAPLMVLKSYLTPALPIPDEALWLSLTMLVPGIRDEPVNAQPWLDMDPRDVRLRNFRQRFPYMFGLLGLWTHSPSKKRFSRAGEPRAITVTPLCRSLLQKAT